MAALARLAAACALAIAAGCSNPAPPPRVLVVGLDGATWDVARPLVAAGEMPNLARLVAGGVSATPVAEEPFFAPVVWTTVFTGVSPAVHGVANWALAGSGYRKVPALWSRVVDAGKHVVLVNVPGTWKAERLPRSAIVADVGMARGYVGGAGGGAFVSLGFAPPPRPYDVIGDFLRATAAPLAAGTWSDWVDVPGGALESGVLRVKRLDATNVFVTPIYARDLGRYATAPGELAAELAGVLGVPYVREGPSWSAYGAGEVPGVFVEHLAQTTALQLATARHLLREHPWDLFVWVDPLPDRIEHAFWTEHDDAHFPDVDRERRTRNRDRVRAAYRDADAHLGAVLADAPPAWTVVVSAHGFGPGLRRDRGDHAGAGLLVVAGAGLPAVDAGEVPLVDVAPTLACLLGVSRDRMAGMPLAAVATARGCR